MRLVWFLTITLVAVTSFTRAQSYYTPYRQLFAGFGPYLRQPVNYGGQPDPRQNTGPVLFPPSPPTNPADTSGIIVGASGYGFVPPNAGLPSRLPYINNYWSYQDYY